MTEMTTFAAAMIMDGEFDLAGFEANEENFLEAAQFLINNGVAWTLQGRVGRVCSDLISQGLCEAAA